MDKVSYVKSQKQTRRHICHWPGCAKQVPPAKWGCAKHWFMLPLGARREIWKNYRIGQEKTLTPSKEYLATATKVEKWIKTNYNPDGTKRTPTQPEEK